MRQFLLVLAVLVPALTVGLGWGPLMDWDENIYGEAAREAVTRGNFFSPTVNGQPFAEKPPLVIWEMAASFRLFGIGEAAARLPSAVNSIVFAVLLIAIARPRLGGEAALLWALMQATALLPLLLARAAVMDASFNALIGLAALCLYEYDLAHEAWRGRGGRRWAHWAWLLGAALAMGLSVLVKGPLGGVIPLVAYASLKLAKPRPWPRLGHIAVCGAVALGVALSWYAANWLTQGDEFLRRFAEFQGMLFSKPLDGHRGPVFYHVIAGVIGLFPWTPLLLLYLLRPVRQAVWSDPATRPLAAMSLGWIAFVLALFSAVQTKLPHYSASMYLPLALLCVLALRVTVAAWGRLPRWVCGLFGGYGLALGALFAVLPYAMDPLMRRAGLLIEPPPAPSPWAWLPGAVLAAGVGWAALGWRRGPPARAVLIAAATLGAFMLGMWRWQLPLVAAYNQGPVLTLMREAYARGGDLALYRMVSFAVLFYGERDVLVLHSYKLQGDPARLDRPGPRPLYVVTPRNRAAQMLREHPGLEPVSAAGDLALYLRPARP